MFGVAYFPCIFGNHLLMWPRDVERCQSTPALPRCVKRLADACASGEGNGCGREMCQDMSRYVRRPFGIYIGHSTTIPGVGCWCWWD